MILAIDTALRFATVSVAEENEVRYAESGSAPRNHAEDLGPLLLGAMSVVGDDLSHIVAGCGPGSFAGLRLGLAAGRTIAWSRGLPVVGLCTLDVLARQCGADFTGYVVTDARRQELYFAHYESGVRTTEPAVAPIGNVAEIVSGARVAGDSVLLTAQDRRATGTSSLDPVVLGLVAREVVAGRSHLPAEPFYLRQPDVYLAPVKGAAGAAKAAKAAKVAKAAKALKGAEPDRARRAGTRREGTR